MKMRGVIRCHGIIGGLWIWYPKWDAREVEVEPWFASLKRTVHWKISGGIPLEESNLIPIFPFFQVRTVSFREGSCCGGCGLRCSTDGMMNSFGRIHKSCELGDAGLLKYGQYSSPLSFSEDLQFRYPTTFFLKGLTKISPHPSKKVTYCN